MAMLNYDWVLVVVEAGMEPYWSFSPAAAGDSQLALQEVL
jgi:hypothetical protein